ncbi:MAG: hypothetical protein PHN84_09535 [Desulfuromonadaceae bacterium]|nr:hypothetical protein [Desulfuromonadaceae bacterium]MDD2856769.1 hypothetical protein [Desulfuromonadaceae bacterium]
MKFGYPYILLVVAGLAGMAWGLSASHRLKKPLDTAAALVVLFGVIAFVIGILLIFIPGFFR